MDSTSFESVVITGGEGRWWEGMWGGGGRHTCVSHTASIMHAPDFNNMDEAALNTFILTQYASHELILGY